MPNDDINIGISYRANKASETYLCTINTLIKAGVTPVVLDALEFNDIEIEKSLDENGILKQDAADYIKTRPYNRTNVAELVSNLDAIIFPGGEDISPTLYSHPLHLHYVHPDSVFDGVRDATDFILMNYCLVNNIPHIGICRGMQMYGVISGSKFILDIPGYFKDNNCEYHNEHRKDSYSFVPHDVEIIDNKSILHEIMGCKFIEKVPSLHHQALFDVNTIWAKVVAKKNHGPIQIIEAVEHKEHDDSFALYVQYHPEYAVAKPQAEFMSEKDGMAIFKALINYCENS